MTEQRASKTTPATPENRGHTVEKIGGTSMSRADAVLENVIIGKRKGAALYNRVFVVSAYGGMTNELLEHKKSGEPGVYALFAGARASWRWSDALTSVGEKMCAINADIFGDHTDLQIADNFVRERVEGVRSCLLDLHRLCTYGHFRMEEHLLSIREMLSALGEAHSAHNLTLLLNQNDVNGVFVDLTGWRDEDHPSLEDRIKTAFDKVDLSTELPVVTGYAHCREGLMDLYDRGYTEITAARIAELTGADEMVIHKEFHLSSADPKVVGLDKVRKIDQTNYDVADQLSNMGMEAIHPRAARGLRRADIPLRVKNTFAPEDPGTLVCNDYVSATPQVEIITGLKSILTLEVFEQDMVGVKGYDATILETLKRHSLRIVTKSSNANTITHYLEGSLGAIEKVTADLEKDFPTARISVGKKAIVSIIGSDMEVPGLSAQAIQALAAADIRIWGIHQLMRNVDLQFIVAEDDFEHAVGALHAALVENTGAGAATAGTQRITGGKGGNVIDIQPAALKPLLEGRDKATGKATGKTTGKTARNSWAAAE